MASTATLALDAVTRSFGDTLALDDLSFTFPAGCITAVIGPSGCGKSTLLKLCNGLERPDSGTVQLFGQPMDYDDLPALRRRIGYAVQGTGLFPHLSAGDNITLLAKVQGWSSADMQQRVEELLALTHLPADLLARHPHQLSGGQQQRIGLCRAMMLRPDLLLLDEPFAAIDPITRQDIHRQLLELQSAEPRTAILVTHDMREALRLAEHVVVMREGRIVCSETTEALRSRHEGQDEDALLNTLLEAEPS